jgi:hypothetical protein
VMNAFSTGFGNGFGGGGSAQYISPFGRY